MENMGFKIEEEEHKDLLNNLPVDGELLLVEFLIHMWELLRVYLKLCRYTKKQEIRAQSSRMHQFVQWTLLSA